MFSHPEYTHFTIKMSMLCLYAVCSFWRTMALPLPSLLPLLQLRLYCFAAFVTSAFPFWFGVLESTAPFLVAFPLTVRRMGPRTSAATTMTGTLTLNRQRQPCWIILFERTIISILAFTQVVLAGWIDMDTPLDKRTTTSFVDGTTYHLVMSDEFNVEGRTFKDGHDPSWTALDKSDDDASQAGGGSLQFYNSSAVTTTNGFLKIATILGKTNWNRFDHVQKTWKHQQTNFTSGMVQSWEKFCFTGGIVEVDVIFPGDPYIGGLWPAVWMLGNLGRATYEASTNNIWPWSFDSCDRELQDAQTISACNAQNHFGMNPYQGRGATEIDIVEVMTGYSKKPLPSTNPPLNFPYGDLTLQVAPGVLKNRPQTGAAPLTKSIISPNGHTEFVAQTWYKGLEMWGNTSINPFFYGTYLAETKPNEPVTRNKNQAFQADAVGAAHQLSPMHFQKPHTFRVEWQPGRGGRLDWYIRSHPSDRTTSTGNDNDGFEHAFSLKDASLNDLMGSQIPIEPTGIIFNVAVSSTWGFPYDSPDWCPKCYDCDDPKCACSFYPGFCQMLRSNHTAMYIDFVRVYQSSNADAHVGANHTLGCDPPGYPTKEWIHGHSYRYMRNPPFSYQDKHPLRPIQRGGGACKTDSDCGGDIKKPNLTALFEQGIRDIDQYHSQYSHNHSWIGRGQCVPHLTNGMFSLTMETGNVCACNVGFTGPHCMAIHHFDDSPSAYKIRTSTSPFSRIHYFIVPNVMFGIGIVLLTLLWTLLLVRIRDQKRERSSKIVWDQQQSMSPIDGSVNRRTTVGSVYSTNTVGYSATR